MAKFKQPQNREADLQAIIEGYEDKIDHPEWLVDAFQKDGIQNSWDARVNHKGKSWTCTTFYIKNHQGLEVVGITDTGTTGLTGCIPENEDDVVRALLSEDPNERLSYFLSSNWSRKPKDALGSRGRGKMIFIGASMKRAIYFDSLRSSDKKYIFGKTYIDANKEISNELYQGNEANLKRNEVFGNSFAQLKEFGTRIFISNPKEDLIAAFEEGFIESHIQHTWWEILAKYKAEIRIEKEGWIKKVSPSPWMPVTNLGIKETDVFETIKLPRNDDLRIKRISFAYLGDKEVPDVCRGLAIQRSGMTVQRLPVSQLIGGEQVGSKIIGSVELEKKLENVIRDNEAPDHYSIFWNRSVPMSLKKVLREKALVFARQFKLIEEERKYASKEQRKAEITVQKEINDLAKSLGFSVGSEIVSKRKKKAKRDPDELLRLSVADFKTPYPSGRVDFEQSIKGAYAVPINEFQEVLNVLIRVYVVHKGSTVHHNGKELKVEKELTIPNKEVVRIGWPEILITKDFKQGKHIFRAKMIAMEDKQMNASRSIEKGEEVYRTISRTFYVEEDPEGKGVFRFQRDDRDDKSKYVWWEYEDKTWIIYWNGEHPIFKPITDDSELLATELRKIGVFVAFTIMCSEEKIKIEEKEKVKIFNPEELKDSSFEELAQSIIRKQSKVLWDRSKK